MLSPAAGVSGSAGSAGALTVGSGATVPSGAPSGSGAGVAGNWRTRVESRSSPPQLASSDSESPQLTRNEERWSLGQSFRMQKPRDGARGQNVGAISVLILVIKIYERAQ